MKRPLQLGLWCSGALGLLCLFVWLWGSRDEHAGGDTPLPDLPAKVWEEFELADRFQRRLTTSYVLVSRQGVNRTLKIDVLPYVDAEAAQQLADDGVMSLEALYAAALSAYPGDISRRIVPKEKYRPRLMRGRRHDEEVRYFRLFSNARLGYGAATDDTVRHRSVLGWFYCRDAMLFFKVRLFAPLATPWEEIEAFLLDLQCP